MYAPREGASTNAGVQNSFTTSCTSSGLMHSYSINVAISVAGKLGQKIHIYFQQTEGKFGTIVQKKH
jgi:hypothetical protein